MMTRKPRGLGAYYINSIITLLLANMFHYTLIIISNESIGSKAFTGILFFSIFIPILFLTPFVGPLLDKKNRRTLLITGQIITLLAYVLLLVAQEYNPLTSLLPVFLIGMALVMGTSLALVVPARISLLADIVPKNQLANATATSALFPMLGFSLAPVCVDFLNSQLNSQNYYELLIALHIMAMFFLVRIPNPSNIKSHNQEQGNLKSYLTTMPLLKETLLFFCLVISIIGPLQTLLPSLLTEELGISSVKRGVFMSSLGIGLIIGGVLCRIYISNVTNLGRIIFTCGGLTCVLVTCIALTETANIVALFLLASGALLGFSASAMTVLIQNFTDDRYRGRLTALFGLIFQLSPALGGLATGLIAQTSSTQISLLLAALFILFFVCIFYWVFTRLNQICITPNKLVHG